MRSTGSRPGRALRFFLRSPILLYRLGLGFLFGNRFLMLTHTGRKTGRPRRAVIEVLRRDPGSGACYVAAAWGERSDWLLNTRRRPEVSVSIGRTSFPARAAPLPAEDGAAELLSYATRHPTAFAMLTRTLTGVSIEATRQACDELARSVPIVELRPLR